MSALSPMQHFRDIPVVPLETLSRHVGVGGPIWPNFDQQTAVRHCRGHGPSDRCATRPKSARPLSGSAVGVGVVDLQFGHLSRLPQSLDERPDDLYLFVLEPNQTVSDVPDWIWQILDWYGLARDKVCIVTEPVQVADLYVAPQGEILGAFTLEPAYLDLLDAITQRNALANKASHVTYVGRAGLVARGMGGHAGEAYLMQVLDRAGVQVIDPASLSIRDQLAHYKGAQVLIYAEGSAIYGRNLLGRAEQDVHILRRRRGRDLGQFHLRPRCNRLQFHPAVGHTLAAKLEHRGVMYHRNAALYNLSVIFDLFGDLGYDLAALWDDDAYRAAVRTDVVGWFKNCPAAPEQFIANLARFEAAGFDLEGPPTAQPALGTVPH
jgi:hypothetical protein